MKNLDTWKDSFLQKGMVIHPESFPFLVVGNKCDLVEERALSQEQAEKIIREDVG